MQESTSSQAATHASHSVLPGSAKARKMTAISGRKCCELLHKQDRLGSFVKMLLVTSHWGSTRCLLTWQSKATPEGRLLFQLAVKTHSTEGIGYGLYSTPTALMPLEASDPMERIFTLKSGKLRKMSKKGVSGSVNWSQERLHLGQLPTPNLCESWMGYPTGWTEIKPSETQ